MHVAARSLQAYNSPMGKASPQLTAGPPQMATIRSAR
jgi:hypothetical protein